MAINIKKNLDEEKERVVQRQHRMKVMSDEIKKANTAAITLKDEAKLREKQLED